jgi:hypothetical protein
VGREGGEQSTLYNQRHILLYNYGMYYNKVFYER